MDEKVDDERVPPWRKLLYDFTQSTTFHGVRFTTEPAWRCRQAIWVTLVLGVTVAFMYILGLRCVEYYSWPTNVNVKIVNKDVMPFPAITICNQNYLRATRSYKEGLYDVVSGNFSSLTPTQKKEEYGGCTEDEPHKVQLQSMKIRSFKHSRVRKFAKVTFGVCEHLCEHWMDIPIEEDDYKECLAAEFDEDTQLCQLYEIEYVPGVLYYAHFNLAPEHDSLVFLKKPCFLQNGKGANITVEAVINAAETLDDNADLRQFGLDIWHDDWLGFVNKSAHQKERMIHSCYWQGERCGPDMFKKDITDYGICYTFDPPNREIRTTGSTFGLKLIVNVEEYEYMPGPNSDAGIKVFLHEPHELAMVRDLGFAVPPGRHSLIGIKATNLINMPPPHGECGQMDLQHYDYDEYTWFRCSRNCETKALVDACGCRDIYMETDKNGGPPLCDMSQYFGCVLPTLKKNAKVLTENHCHCLKPCNRTVYEPVVSNAALSSLSIDEILAHNQQELKARKWEASDTQVRVQHELFFEVVKTLFNVRDAYNGFRDDLMRLAKNFNDQYIAPIVDSFKGIVDIFESDMNQQLFYQLDEVIEDLDTIFGPGKDTLYFMIERVIRNSNLITMHIRNYIAEDYAYGRLEELIDNAIEYAEAVVFTLPKYTKMVQSVSGSLTSFGFADEDFPFLPRFIARKSDECDHILRDFNNQTYQIKYLIEILKTEVKAKLNGEDPDINLRNEMMLFKLYENTYNLMKSKCLDPYFSMTSEIREFNSSFKQRLAAHTELDYSFDFDYEAQEQTRERREFKYFMDMYLEEYRIEKKELQRNLSEDLINGYIATERALIDKIKIRLSERLSRRMDLARGDIEEWYYKLFDLATELKSYMAPAWGLRRMLERAKNLTIWKEPVAVADPIDQLNCNCDYYFKNTNGPPEWEDGDYLGPRGKQKVHDIVDAYFKPITDAMNDFDKLVNIEEQALSSALKVARNLMTEYRINDEMNQAFIANNFLQMDVYYSELRETKIIEYPSFTIEDLLSDIGGYMGLLLGASVTTVFEFIDVIIYGMFRKAASTKNNRPPLSSAFPENGYRDNLGFS